MAARRNAGSAPCISLTNSNMRAGPSEQLTPATSTPSAARMCATSAGPAPAVVTPSFPSVTSATTGRSVVWRATRTATANSSRSEKVSKISRSAPASQRMAICSAKAAAASPCRNLPPERARLPRGPTEPAIQAACPLISLASRASLTPRKLISLTLSASPYSTRRRRLPPNVLVWMISAPALI